MDIDGQPVGVQAEPPLAGGPIGIRARKASLGEAELPQLWPDMMQRDRHPTVQNQRAIAMGEVAYAAQLAPDLDWSLDPGFGCDWLVADAELAQLGETSLSSWDGCAAEPLPRLVSGIVRPMRG